jgi:NAD(P)H dehydrogenase (quinone)
MENIFNSLPTVASEGAIYTTVPGTVTAPQIATKDIAEVAAEFLTTPRTGHLIVDIIGPEDFSYNDMASALTRVTGKTVRIVNIPGEAFKQAVKHAGFSEEMAELLVEMEESFANGLPHELLGDEKRVGKTTYEQFLHETFLSAYQGATNVARAS